MSRTRRASRHIPVPTAEILQRCAADEDVRRLLAALIGVRWSTRLRGAVSSGSEEIVDAAALRDLTDSANYERLTDEELQLALAERSHRGLTVRTDLASLRELALYRRGERTCEDVEERWLGLRRRTFEVVTYDRVLLHATTAEGESVLKLFRDVPRKDVDMLFPGTVVRMPLRDRLFVWLPAVVGGVLLVATKLVTAFAVVGLLIEFWLGLRHRPVHVDKAAAVAVLVAFGSLVTFVWRQYTGYKNRKLCYLERLADRLYRTALDQGVGVVHHLVDEAEQQEIKEAAIAYSVLLGSARPLTVQELDRAAERWLCDQCGVRLDFDYADVVGTLLDVGLAETRGTALCAVPPDRARPALRRAWAHALD